jgi:hypothetical protein
LKRNVVPAILAAMVAGLLSAAPAHAQATRTWVSGVGDDANPCSRTAPCKTFAGAISKTAVGGEINVLDPGGFGALTITKAITVSSVGFEAGVLVSGTNGIVVQAGPNDDVYLSGLDIEGLGTGLSGVRFNTGGSLHIINSKIHGFTTAAPDGNGVLFAPSNNAKLFIKDLTIEGNGIGVEIRPVGGANAQVSIQRTTSNNNTTGFRCNGTTGATGQILVDITDSVAAGNTAGSGFSCKAGTSPRAIMMLNHDVATGNLVGINVDGGTGGTGSILVGSSIISMNTTGVQATNAGSATSFGTNQLLGNNSSDGSFTGSVSPLK